MDRCFHTGCSTVITLLDPCGGGATNSSLQQDLVYTPTKSLGACECNSYFFNNLSSCLSCIASQAENFPEIEDQPGWVDNCNTYGFNFTATPITNSTNNNNNNDNNNDSGSGLSTGAIVGIVVGAIVLLALIIIGAWFYFRGGNKNKQTNEKKYEHSSITTGAGAAGAESMANYQETEYSDAYNHQGQNDHYANYTGNIDPNTQNRGYSSEYQDGYYGTNNYNNNSTMVQNANYNSNQNDVYVPPPPHPSSTSTKEVAGGGERYSNVSRPLDSQPQSLRSKPKGWDSPSQNDVSSSLPMGHTLKNDKTEFDEGEELEPPRTINRYGSQEFIPRRSMTPPRANMQSYRDEYSRPSTEREPRRSGSDIGSVSGIHMVRGVESGSINYTNYDQSMDDPRTSQDSPESARRRARAAELFSA
ncbi:hypothetical protein BGZ76_010719 [Entomortierella beljakovae]|nr:hypothetical protein BGZ76_010719 [Entomortierella beljakovae]